MWFYAKDGEQQGPVEAEVIRERLNSGELSNGTLVWREGMAQWQPLEEVLELREPVPDMEAMGGTDAEGLVASAEPIAAIPGPAEQVPCQAPNLVAPVQQNGMAIASLVLGICVFMTCGLTGFVGIPLGHIARKKIRNSPVPQSGEGMALAGLIMSYIGAVFFLLYLAFIVFAVVMEGRSTLP